MFLTRKTAGVLLAGGLLCGLGIGYAKQAVDNDPTLYQCPTTSDHKEAIWPFIRMLSNVIHKYPCD